MRTSILVVGAIVVVAALGLLAYYYFSQGHVDIYVSDPPSPQRIAIYVTFTSIALHRVNANGTGGWIVLFNGSRTVELTSTPQLLLSASVPAGEYNEVFFTISEATVQIDGSNITARIPSGVFKVHIIGGMRLNGGSSEKLLISFPHVVFHDGELIISPSITAQVVS